MSWNVTWVCTLRTIVVVGLLFALAFAMLSSIGLNGHTWPDRAGAPEAPSQSPRGYFGGTVTR